jgi:hypothetical protein
MTTTQQPTQKNNKARNFILIILVAIFLLLIIVSASFAYAVNTSPQMAYLQFSQAIEDRDTQALADMYDCEAIKKNYLNGVGQEEPNCDDLGNQPDEFFDSFDNKYLADSIFDAYNNGYFERKGDTYVLSTQYEEGSLFDSEINYIFSKTGNGWKITDIDFGVLEEFMTNISDDDSITDWEESATQSLENAENITVLVGESKQVGSSTVELQYDFVTETQSRELLDDIYTLAPLEGGQLLRLVLRNEYDLANFDTAYSITNAKLVSKSNESEVIELLDFLERPEILVFETDDETIQSFGFERGTIKFAEVPLDFDPTEYQLVTDNSRDLTFDAGKEVYKVTFEF